MNKSKQNAFYDLLLKITSSQPYNHVQSLRVQEKLDEILLWGFVQSLSSTLLSKIAKAMVLEGVHDIHTLSRKLREEYVCGEDDVCNALRELKHYLEEWGNMNLSEQMLRIEGERPQEGLLVVSTEELRQVVRIALEEIIITRIKARERGVV